jgi:hypothetical protein
MQLRLTPFSSKLFSCNRKRGLLVAELSDLGVRPGNSPLSQLYDDAADVGLAIRSDETGVTTVWHWSHDVINADDEVEVMIFRPTHETVRSNPQLDGYELHLIND